jgi:hypothetical protein
MKNTRRIAVLIDGENIESGNFETILSEVEKHGNISIKRIYGDWSQGRLCHWKKEVNRHAIKVIQKFSYTKGKNSTDSALIIDAMDILHAKLVDGFCIVSSDSDFIGLAHRIREEGLFVMGAGRIDTQESMIESFDHFHKISNPLSNNPDNIGARIQEEMLNKKETFSKNTPLPFPESDLEKAFEKVSEKYPCEVTLSRLSNELRNLIPGFNPKNYGCSNLKTLYEKMSKVYLLEFLEVSNDYSVKRNYGLGY